MIRPFAPSKFFRSGRSALAFMWAALMMSHLPSDYVDYLLSEEE